MPIHSIPGNVTAAKGFTAGGVCCSIRAHNTRRKDLALIVCDTPCTAAGVYTKNKVQSATIPVTRAHLSDGTAQAVIVNSYIANTCVHDGQEVAEGMCRLAAEALGLQEEDVLVASTGVIGQSLPLAPIQKGIGLLKEVLSRDGGTDAANAILTTDTRAKEVACEFRIGDRTVRMGGIAKGSGMVHVNMGTMLAFITTDAAISAQMLDRALRAVVEDTFNMVTVDGDTSTNDMLLVLASGRAENTPIREEGEDYALFLQALDFCCRSLAKQIAADGEGATKLLVCRVQGAKSRSDARIAARAVVGSSLLKAAIFGKDANWGRILCALGYSEAQMDVHAIDVWIESRAGRVQVCANGYGLVFDEPLAARILSEEEVTVDVRLHDGEGDAEAYGCDLTYDYVRINGDYRS